MGDGCGVDDKHGDDGDADTKSLQHRTISINVAIKPPSLIFSILDNLFITFFRYVIKYVLK